MEQQMGYVALLDVLGFTELVSGGDQKGKLSDYIDTLELVTTTSDVDAVLFSDSIVMTSQGDSEECLLKLLRACSTAFGCLLSREIPIRGAISFGSYVRRATTRGVFLAGRAIIEAYRFQQKQDWVGIMLAPSVIKTNPHLVGRRFLLRSRDERIEEFQKQFEWVAFVQPCGIPFHTSVGVEFESYEGFAVVPTDTEVKDAPTMNQNIKRAMNHLERLRLLAPDPQSQKKFMAAWNWLNSFESHWR